MGNSPSQGERSCVICLDNGKLELHSDYFKCECKNNYFHSHCWEQYQRQHGICPLCRKEAPSIPQQPPPQPQIDEDGSRQCIWLSGVFMQLYWIITIACSCLSLWEGSFGEGYIVTICNLIFCLIDLSLAFWFWKSNGNINIRGDRLSLFYCYWFVRTGLNVVIASEILLTPQIDVFMNGFIMTLVFHCVFILGTALYLCISSVC